MRFAGLARSSKELLQWRVARWRCPSVRVLQVFAGQASRDLSQARMGKKRAGGDLSRTTCAYVQVLGAGTDVGGVPAAMLVFDHLRFLFNVPEGFQRFAAQHKIRLTKISAVMLTRGSIDVVGGLPGMLLTVHDALASGGGPVMLPTIQLSGLRHTSHLMKAMSTFMNMREYDLRTRLFDADSEEPLHEDDTVSIRPVTLSVGRVHTAENEAASTDDPCAEREPKRPRTQSDHDGQQQATCYIAKLADIPGKFMPEKAAELGVPKGPSYGRLVKGEAIDLENGSRVFPHQVMQPGTPGPVVIIVDCPTVNHIASLVANQALDGMAVFKTEEGADPTICLVHLSPMHVVVDERYQRWMHTFGEMSTHIMAGVATGHTVMISAARIQCSLNAINPTVFPIHSTMLDPASNMQLPNTMPKSSTVGTNLMKFHLRPASRIGIDASEVPPSFSVAEVRDEALKNTVLAKAIDAARKSACEINVQSLPESLKEIGPSECEVTFLGTGSAMPSKYRNVTGLHVNLFERGGMMLDCGEDSYGQLIRRYGHTEAERLLGQLKLVWISHIHADHHIGLSQMLLARQRVLGPKCPPLPIIGPGPLRRTLSCLEEFIPLQYTWIDGINLLPKEQKPDWWISDEKTISFIHELEQSLGLKKMENAKAVHCAHSYGVAFEAIKGWKVAFSGDTRPCPSIIQMSRKADLLIHEATFDDDMIQEAHAKKHSMTAEAVQVGREAEAFRTLLTHFSQRYPKIPVIAPSFRECTCIAFDLMSVNLATLAQLPSFVPPLALLFDESRDEAENEVV